MKLITRITLYTDYPVWFYRLRRYWRLNSTQIKTAMLHRLIILLCFLAGWLLLWGLHFLGYNNVRP